MLKNYCHGHSASRIRETGTGVRRTPRMPDSKIQTETDVDEHCLTRFAFPLGSWCALCVRGRGQAEVEGARNELFWDGHFVREHTQRLRCILFLKLCGFAYGLLVIAFLMFCLLGGCVLDFLYCTRTALAIHLHDWLKLRTAHGTRSALDYFEFA